jgi:hypothetical protein
MTELDEIVDELEVLTPASLQELARFVEFLKWKQSPGTARDTGRPWSFDFVEEFRHASVTAEHGHSGMDVQLGEAACDGEWHMALWQHPPTLGASIVEYQVPVPAEVRNLRLVFFTGIRDGSQLASGNIVAFRIFVNDWRLWSHTQHASRWFAHEVEMPSTPGDVVRIQFVTDGLGNHQWAWAAWGEPRLIGEIPA